MLMVDRLISAGLSLNDTGTGQSYVRDGVEATGRSVDSRDDIESTFEDEPREGDARPVSIIASSAASNQEEKDQVFVRLTSAIPGSFPMDPQYIHDVQAPSTAPSAPPTTVATTTGTDNN